MVNHTWYLSRIPRIYPWRKICHVEKFEISPHDRCGEFPISPHLSYEEIRNYSICGEFLDFSTSVMLEIWYFSTLQICMVFLCCFYALFSHFMLLLGQKKLFLRFTLFCREICFVTIYALLRGEKLSQKLYPWRKNDKYQVCPLVLVLV